MANFDLKFFEMKKALVNAKIFDGDQFLEANSIMLDGQVIEGITDKIFAHEIDAIDCKGHILCPGFVDLQVYGGGGSLFSNDLSVESLNKIADALVNNGTTSFFITLATNSTEVFKKAISIVKQCSHPAVKGIHFEGPFINPKKRGAHLEKYIHPPSIEELKELLDSADGIIKMLTIAPEQCDKKVIDFLKRRNIVLSAGHSNATFEQANDGFNNGITTVTHLFNAMSPFHHRDIGLPGATFLSKNVYASIICDGIHTDYNAVKIAKALMGDRLFLITDAVEEATTGDYLHIKKEDRFVLPDGTLSGSALTMLNAVKNYMNHVDLNIEKALKMATLFPAKVGKITKAGKLGKGNSADIICLTDQLELKFVMSNGSIINQEI